MKVALVFPGYSSQFVGMGKELYDEYRVVQEFFEEASSCLNINFVKLIFASSEDELKQMSNAYTSLFLIGCAIAQVLKQEGITATMAAGYNTGEYAALWTAQGITLPDGLYLLSKYATIYAHHLQTSDVAMYEVTGIEHQELQALCSEVTRGDDMVSIAIYESSHRAYISGMNSACKRLIALAEQIKKVRVKPAPLEIGLHSALMQPVLAAYQPYMEKADFKDLALPLITSVKAEGIVGGQTVKAALLESIE